MKNGELSFILNASQDSIMLLAASVDPQLQTATISDTMEALTFHAPKRSRLEIQRAWGVVEIKNTMQVCVMINANLVIVESGLSVGQGLQVAGSNAGWEQPKQARYVGRPFSIK